jgi:hypothetical protein
MAIRVLNSPDWQTERAPQGPVKHRFMPAGFEKVWMVEATVTGRRKTPAPCVF